MTDFNTLLAALEPSATAGESEWSNVAQCSIAVSLKRIADIMESAQEPVISGQDMESDPLMIIARAIEELARPTLPPPIDAYSIADREAKAIEDIRDMLRDITRGGAVRQIRA